MLYGTNIFTQFRQDSFYIKGRCTAVSAHVISVIWLSSLSVLLAPFGLEWCLALDYTIYLLDMSSRHGVILKCFATQRILKILWTTKQTAVLHYYRSLCKCMLNCRIMANVTFSPAACLLFVIINPIMVLHHRLLTSAQEDILFGCNPYYRINCHCKSLLIHWLLPKKSSPS